MPFKEWKDCRVLLPGASCSLRRDTCLLSAGSSWASSLSALQQLQQQETDKGHATPSPVALQQAEKLLVNCQQLLPHQVSLFAAQLLGGERLIVRLHAASAVRLMQQQEGPEAAEGNTSRSPSTQDPEQRQQHQQQQPQAQQQQAQQQQEPQGQQRSSQGQETGSLREKPLETVVEISTPSGR